MRVRKIAKQLKAYFNNVSWNEENDEPVFGYKVGDISAKNAYIMRMTKKRYFGERSKYEVGSMMYNYYTHKACSYDIFEDILEYWGINIK